MEVIAWVAKDDKYFTIDQNNETIFKLKKGYEPEGDFHDGLAIVSEEGWFTPKGYVNKTDEFVIPVKYELANDFKNGVASVKIKDGNYIYINTKGEEVEIDD